MTGERDDLYRRAVKIFGLAGHDVRWPYGLNAPRRSLKTAEPEEHDRLLGLATVAQRTIVEWAERYGLRASSSGCCPRWLQRYASRRCAQRTCACSGPDHGWLDHSVFWLKDREPAVITSAPYHILPEDKELISGWLNGEIPLRAAFGVGWYGFGAHQVVMWRPDRIEDVEPAAPAAR